MANLILAGKTKLSGDDVIVRAVQFFSNQKWRTKSQSARIATFEGRPPIPWFLILLTFLGFLFFIIPGIIMYFLVVRKVYGFHNIVITTKDIDGGSEVDINYPKHAKKLVSRFFDSLPPYESAQLEPQPQTA
jgi:hypothetical protein